MQNDYFVPITKEEDELYHHGILGMKWGVRRYQNPDGTLTYAGRKRLAKDDYKLASDKANQKYEKKVSKTSSATVISKAKALRDQELSEAYSKYRKDRYDAKTDRDNEKAEKKEAKELKKNLEEMEKDSKSGTGKDFVKAFVTTVGVIAVSKLIDSKLNSDSSEAIDSAMNIGKKFVNKLKSKIETGSIKTDKQESKEETKQTFEPDEIWETPSSSKEKSSSSSRVIYDVEWEDVTNKGSNYISGLLGSGSNSSYNSISGSTPVSGLLESGKRKEL